MSERNIELTRRHLEAYNARDADALVSYCDPNIEFHPLLPGALGGAAYRGHDGMRRWLGELAEASVAEMRVEVEAFFDLGEQILVFGALRGRGRSSGAEVTMPSVVVFRWRDGLVVYLKGYADREDALRDLYVSEDELERIAP